MTAARSGCFIVGDRPTGFVIWWERGEGCIDLVLGFDAMLGPFLTFNPIPNPDIAEKNLGMM